MKSSCPLIFGRSLVIRALMRTKPLDGFERKQIKRSEGKIRRQQEFGAFGSFDS